MPATIARVLKKFAICILTDKKALKVVGGIILGILILIIMPITALLGIFTGGLNIDMRPLHEIIERNQSTAEVEWEAVEISMEDAGCTSLQIQEAQVLYSFVLYEYSWQDGFNENLARCFSSAQTDEQLIDEINESFGTNISLSDFINAVSGIRNAYIDTSDYVLPTTKNNLDLVKWAENAYKKKWGYVCGTYGEMLDENLLDKKLTQYPDEVGDYEDTIRQKWLGNRTADCIGLIKGYGWFNSETQEIILGSNGMPDVNADGMYEAAVEKGTLDTIPEIQGVAVWREGHIGIYIGNGIVIHASGTEAGVIMTPLNQTGWTHWLKIPYLVYMEEPETKEYN